MVWISGSAPSGQRDLTGELSSCTQGGGRPIFSVNICRRLPSCSSPGRVDLDLATAVRRQDTRVRPERALWREESLPRGSFCISSWGACIVPGPTRALGTQGTESWLLPSPGWQSSGTGRQVTGDQETRVPVGGRGGVLRSGPVGRGCPQLPRSQKAVARTPCSQSGALP